MTAAAMVNKKYLLYLTAGLILALFSIQESVAQLNSPTADHVDTLSYLSGNPAKDPLFVFYQTDGIYKPGALSATLPGGGSFNFEWSMYNSVINGFDPAFSSESGSSSSVGSLDEGGYRVRIWNGTGTDTTLMSWVMLDHLQDSVVQTTEGTLPGYLYTCDIVAVGAYVSSDTLVYYDLLSHELISKPLRFSFKWTSDNEDLIIPNDTTVLRPNISYMPPYRDTEYSLTVTDEFGMSDVDNVLYESIQTKAEFSVEYHDKINNEYSADLTGDWSADQGSLDALLTVKYTNQSLNGVTFDWVYLDTVGGVVERETTYDLETLTEFTYQTADEYYYPYMISTSQENCTDTFRLEEAIHVVRSQLIIPNVFSPNGDGVNDYFVFKHQSLRTCKISIVDRNGKMIYKREIEDIYTWDGWNGNLHDSNRNAPEGQYYFVVEALGYDGVEYRDPTIIEKWRGNTGGTGSTGGSNPDGTETASNQLYTGWLYLYRHKAGY